MNLSSLERNRPEPAYGTVSVRSAERSLSAGRRDAVVLALSLAVVVGLLPLLGGLTVSRAMAAEPADETVSNEQPEPAAATVLSNRSDAADEDRRPAATRRAGIPTTPREMIDALRWYFVVPFVLASVMAVWFGIERLVVLRRGRVIPRPFVERFLQHLRQGKLNPAKALSLCEENGSPVAAIFAHGVRKWGKPSVEVEQAIIDGGERQVSQMRKHLRVLNGIATVTPLIGLLGTVIGMILAFNEIANSNAMGKAEELAGGIALALLTTAAGLLIAIPSLIMYTYLAGRVDALVMEMDDLAQNVVQLISAEGLSNRTVASPRVRSGSRKVSAKPPAESPEKKAV